MNNFKKTGRKNIGDILALTPMQEGLLFHYLKDRESDFYFEQLCLTINGEVDFNCFKQAWNFVIETNEMLRTYFRWEKLDKPAQIVLKTYPLHLRYYDLSIDENIENIEDTPGKKKKLERVKREDRREKFNLQEVPFRISLCKISGSNYCIIISHHHILFDGWSTGIILKEFFQAYHALHKGDRKLSRPSKSSFKEFIKWFQKRSRDKEKMFWKNYLEDLDTQTHLPIKRSQPTPGVTGGEVYGFVLEKDIRDKLEIFIKKNRVTLAVFFYCVWGILLRRYGNNDDIVFGTTVSGRSAKIKGIEDMVGLFIQTLPLRMKSHSNEKIPDILNKLKQALQVREDYESSALVDIKKYSGFLANEELFDTVVVIENYPLDNRLKQVKGPLSADSYSTFEMTHYDLTVGISLTDDIVINFFYWKALFDKKVIIQLSHHFTAAIENVLDNPGKRISGVEIISSEDKKQVLVDFNSTDAHFPRDKTIHQLFVDQVEQTPDHIAVIGSSQIKYRTYMTYISYRELNKRANRLAYLLEEKGVKPDTIVGIMVRRSMEMIIGILGILKAGGAYLPIDPDYPQERIDYMLNDSNAKILLTERDINPPPKALLTLSEGRPFNSHHSCSLAYIIYTSGTTGNPKGVTIEHGPVVNLLWGLNKLYPFTGSDIYLLKTSYIFDVSGTELFGWFPGGGSLTLLEKGGEKDPAAIVNAIEYSGVTHINFVPSQFNAFVDVVNRQGAERISGLKYIFLAGEALLPELVNKFKSLGCDVQVENLYGPTEAAVYASGYSLVQWRGKGSGGSIPIGKPLQNTRLYVLDKDNCWQPVGIVGELCITGVGLARGYLNRPESTAKRFVNYKLQIANYRSYKSHMSYIYRTGDLARWLPDGNIEFMGRIDFQVKIRGFRVELGEIENRLLKHQGVKEVVVTAMSDETGDHFLCAYIVPQLSGSLEIPRLRAYLREKLPDYMIPAYLVTLAEIPMTPTGKIDRKSLPKPQIKPKKEYAPPRNETENKLVDIWSEVLGIDKHVIGIVDNFFELGGHSLRAIRLMGRLYKEFNIELPLAALFKKPTVMGLAGYIGKAAKSLYCEIQPIEKKEYYVLSSVQQRLFVLHQLDSNHTNYNMHVMMLLEGALKKEKFEKVFGQLIARHESLRTSFHLVGSEPVQRVHDHMVFEIEYYSAEHKEERCASLIKNFIRPFDLSQAPLLRVGLIKPESHKHILIVDMHHIISDGTSAEILIQDFMALYEGKELATPGNNITYKDFSTWQNRQKESHLIKQQAEYWLKEFAGEIPVPDIPTDFSRPPVQSFAGNTAVFEIGKKETAKLKALALETGSTLFITLLALFNVLLSKMSGQEEIVVGSPTAGRRYVELEKIVGMFVNTLALKNFPPGEKTFVEFLKEVKNRTLASFAHQDYPYEELVEVLDVDRNTGRNPLFDTMFVLQNMDMSEIEIPGLKLKFYDCETIMQVSKFDLTLIAVEAGKNLRFTFEYCTKIFREETIQRFIRYFKKIISGVLAEPGGKISGIEIISEDEKQQLLVDFNDTTADYPRDKTIHELFAEQAERTPDNIAVTGSSEIKYRTYMTYKTHISYRELNGKSNQLAYLLGEKGVKTDTIVGIMMERAVEMIIGLLGILKAGGAYLPIDPNYPEERKKYMLKDSNAGILLTHKDITPSPSTLTSTCQVSPTNLAYVIYTSGSTGKPKGVLVKHRSFVNLVYFHQKVFGEGPRERLSQAAGPGFDAMAFEVWPCLLNGGTLLIADNETRANSARMKDWLIENAITISFQPTVIAEQLLMEKWPRQGAALKALRTAGEQLTRYPGNPLPFKFYNLYGPTEDTVWTTWAKIGVKTAQSGTKYPSIGKPIANHRVYIMGTDFKLQPPGIRGELCIAGKGLAVGYLNRPGLTTEKFVEDPFIHGEKMYKTGDLARWLPDGNIEFLGRLDQQVKIRGFRIEPGEIESHLLSHPHIKEAIVLAKKNKTNDKCLCAYVVYHSPDIPKEQDVRGLREYLSKELPGYMVPAYFVILDKIPLTHNGKVDWRSLPGPETRVSENEFVPPQDEIEEKLAEIWSGVLGIEKYIIGINSDFFELGGHSLKAMMLASRIDEALNREVGLTEIFKRPTIKRLAEYIKDSSLKRYPSIEIAEKKEYYALSSAQKRLYVLQQMDKRGVGYNIPSVLILEGRVDEARLEDTFSQSIKRHEGFRTSFEIIERDPVQKIHEPHDVKFEIQYFDLRISEEFRDVPGGQTPEVESIIQNFICPFDLSKAPLMRVGLMELPHTPAALRGHPSQEGKEHKYILMVDMHHIISDGISMGLFVKEFLSIYSGEILPGIKIQYKDFSEWRNSKKVRELKKQQEQYWLKEFRGEIPRLTLPADYARPEIQSFEGDTLNFDIGIEKTKALKKLALQEGATLFITILSIYNIMLAKIAGQRDIIVGTEVTGRSHADLENVIGMFVNTLALRNFPGPGKTFKEFLQDIKERTLKAFENQAYQFEELVEKLSVNRDAGQNPIFDVIFSFLDIEMVEGGLVKPGKSGLKVKPYKFDYSTAKFDLALNVIAAADQVLFAFEYGTRLFRKETIEEFITYFREIVSLVVKNPDVRIWDIEIVSEEEQRRLLRSIKEDEGFIKNTNVEKVHETSGSSEAEFDF